MDRFSKEKRSDIMSKIRGKRTGPEMIVHNYLKGRKVRHKMWPKMLGNPDVYIKGSQLVIFINGCFWHGCRKHFRLPKTNRVFWERKIRGNVERQRDAIRRLKKAGFTVVVLWEHDLAPGRETIWAGKIRINPKKEG